MICFAHVSASRVDDELEVLLQARVLQGRRLVRLSAGSELLSRDFKGYIRVNTDMDVHNRKEHDELEAFVTSLTANAEDLIALCRRRGPTLTQSWLSR